MSVEQLLQMLREAQMDDAAIKQLLTEAIASLEGPAENAPAAQDEEAEKAEAGEMLGVSL
jgi:hypothetical protein